MRGENRGKGDKDKDGGGKEGEGRSRVLGMRLHTRTRPQTPKQDALGRFSCQYYQEGNNARSCATKGFEREGLEWQRRRYLARRIEMTLNILNSRTKS